MREHTDTRGSPRVPAKIPLRVEGRDRAHQPVSEDTYTLLINQAGALIALSAEFQLNDRIKVTNKETGATSQCRIAWRSVAQLNGRWSYGIALLDSVGTFWEFAEPAN
jgi:hypothetical protein